MYSWVVILSVILKIVSTASLYVTTSTPKQERAGRIVEGRVATIEEFPYLVQITGYHESYVTLCGGVILSLNVIITSAHCFDDDDHENSWYQVQAGSSFNNRGGSLHNVRNITIHPGYDKNLLQHDLAMLKLEDSIKLDNKTKRSISLFESDQTIRDGTIGTIAGWGKLYDNGPHPDQLRSLKMKIVSRKDCTEMYKKAYKERLNALFGSFNNGQICANSVTGDGSQSFCDGDSGGPLIIGNKLAGIMSFTKIDCTTGLMPNVFTKISHYRQWIDQILTGYNVNPTKKPNHDHRSLHNDLNNHYYTYLEIFP